VNAGNLEQIISILNGRGIELNQYPQQGRDAISEPGYYYNSDSAHIEHWSQPCLYTHAMYSHFSNKNQLVQDGFKSILAVEDIDELVEKINNWTAHLVRYGVIR
jgi:hypothetical protein